MELTVTEIWEKLTNSEMEEMRDICYDYYMDEYKTMLIDNGEVRDIE